MVKRDNDSSRCIRTPRLFIWAREALYLGTCKSRQTAHRTTQEKLVLSLQGSLKLLTPQGSRISVRSCLLPTDLWLDRNILDASEAVIGVYYLASFSQDYAALASIMQPAQPGIYHSHPNEHAIIQIALDIRNRKQICPIQACEQLRAQLIPSELANRVFREFDPRVIAVAKHIRETLLQKVMLADLARKVRLSSSRLEKLFKAQTGLAITTYRMRCRVFISTILMALGYSMTEAALCAGFANSAHLSRSYRAINGITPSALFLRPPYLDTTIAPSAMELLTPFLEPSLAANHYA
nr:AraC-like protein [uncultured bacterium]